MSYFLILYLKNIYMLERKNDDHFFLLIDFCIAHMKSWDLRQLIF